LRAIVEVNGSCYFHVDPESEKWIRDELAAGDGPKAYEFAYILDGIISDVDLMTDLVLEEDDGTLLWEGEL
jgi:hypothetical protein